MASKEHTLQWLGVEAISSTVGKIWSDTLQTAAQYGPALLPATLDRSIPPRRQEH